ncbi:MAG: sulfate ABC transporter substrate-binding protein [Bryobacteraceae bacterium]|jgi:sulfate/thiosulfate transport system substrate-binding protein
MNSRWLNIFALGAVALSAALVAIANVDRDKGNEILNVSYDPTRELFTDLNQQFVAKYQRDTGRRWTIRQSHGGSSRQSRAVIDGLKADVVTLALFPDVDALRKRGLIPEGWSKRLPHDSQPFTSTIVFVVRKGNPKHIRDWPDLAAQDVSVITPNPKTSGNGKLSVLAAWGSVVYRGGTEAQAREYLTRLYQNASVLDSGARGATTTFADEKVGDVHLTWENEALLETEASGGELQIVYPPVSIRAEPTVAWLDANVAATRKESVAKAYLQFLFTDAAQETIARHGYRPLNDEILRRHADRLPRIDLFPVTLLGKDWDEIWKKFFDDNAIFDAIYKPKATS